MDGIRLPPTRSLQNARLGFLGVLRILRTFSVVSVIALAAGCSGTTASAGTASPTVALPSVTATTPAASTPAAAPTPVAMLTAACPLLSADELQALLGGGISKTKLTAIEDKPTTTTVDTSYMCEYGSNGNNPFALDVSGSKSQDGFTPKAAIDAIAKAAKTTTHSVTGVGVAAVFYTVNGISVLAAAKVTHGQLRTVVFSAPAVVPEQKFIDVVRLMIDRI